MTPRCLARLWFIGMIFSTPVATMEPLDNPLSLSHEISTRKRKRCESLYRNQPSFCECAWYKKSESETLEEEAWEIAMFQMQLNVCFSSPFQSTTGGMIPLGQSSPCFCKPEKEDTPSKPRKNRGVDISTQPKNGTVVPWSIPYTNKKPHTRNNLKKLVKYLEEKNFSKRDITAMAGYQDKDNVARNFRSLQSLKNKSQIQQRYGCLFGSVLENPAINIKDVLTFMNGSTRP